MPTKERVLKVMETFGLAWRGQDSDLILSIFSEDATYQEGPFATPMKGHAAIRQYWETKVVKGQADIHFHLHKCILEDEECAVEWDAEFDDLVANEHVELYEVAFLIFKDGKISSLRETWRSKRSPILTPAT